MELWNRVLGLVGPHRIARAIRFYPPYLAAGVRIREAREDLRFVHVEMPLTLWNRSYVGTHVGGALFALCDPFYMIMLVANLGPAYVVLDKSAEIRFIRPGRSTVTAKFHLSDAVLEGIRQDVAARGKSHPRFEVQILDEDHKTVARVDKVLSVKPAGSETRTTLSSRPAP